MNIIKTLFAIAFSITTVAVMGGQKAKVPERTPVGGYTVTGDIDGLKCVAGSNKGINFNEGYIYLYGAVSNGKTIVDSAKVIDGRFIFKGRTDEPIRAVLICKTSDHPYPVEVDFFIENANIGIAGKYDASNRRNPLENVKVTGSSTEEEYKSFMDGANAIRAKLQVDMNLAYKEHDTTARAVLIKRINETQSEMEEYYQKYYETHPKSYVKLYLMGSYIPSNKEGLDRLEQDIKKMGASIQASFKAKSILREIAEERKVLAIGPGTRAMDFSQPDVNGKMVKLSDYKGKYVLLDFWASWCGPCRRENPSVLKAYNKYHEKGLEILAVSMDNSKDAWLKAIKEDGLLWKQVSDLQGWENSAGRKYFIHAIPRNFLINPEGMIIAKDLRGDALEKNLKEIFK